VTTYPVELVGGFSGLSSGQIQSIAKAPFTQHLDGVPIIGSKTPRTLVGASGAWFFDNTPHGDFTGTLLSGGGGPAQLPCGPTGDATVVAIGRVASTAGAAASLTSGTATTTTAFKTEYSITYDHANYQYAVRFLRTSGTAINVTACNWTASTLRISKTGGFSSYTYTGWDMVRVYAPSSGATLGWYVIKTKVDNDTIELTSDASILSAVNLTGSVSIDLVPSAMATYIGGCTWTNSTKTITATGQFSTYTPGSDDIVLIRSGTGTIAASDNFESWTKVVSKTNADSIVVADADIADNGASDLGIVLFRRPVYEEAPVSTVNADGVNVTLSSALATAPKFGDLYYLYITHVYNDTAAAFEVVDTVNTTPTNDPENVPTESASGTKFCPWPYNTPGPQIRASLQGHAGLCSYPFSRDKTQMHFAWWGNFTLPKESFIYGDKIEIDLSGSVTYSNTPFIFEVLLIPNFDPETFFNKAHNTANAGFASQINQSIPHVWMQTQAISSSGSREVTFKIIGQSMGYTRAAGPASATQYSQLWEMNFAANSGSTAQYTGDVVSAKRSMRVNFSQNAINMHESDTRWTVLVKTEHPYMTGKPGSHGYYFGEPFSATTGNGGGTWLHHSNTTPSVSYAPVAPRTVFQSFSVKHYPAGSY